MPADPIAALREQRKFAMFLIVMVPVGIGALAVVAFVAVNLFRGKMTLEAATAFIFGAFAIALTGAVAMGSKVIDANTTEDKARIEAAAKPVAQAPVETVSSSIETPAETPQAKR